MFANEDFIAATRPFVCIRIETYENAAAEKRVRSLLGGSYANTSFCVFDHTGEKRISASGRSPSSLVRRRGGGTSAITAALKRIGDRYGAKDPVEGPALLPDAPNFKQGLNVAAGDQRLLLCVGTADEPARLRVREVMSDEDIVGRFHVDVLEEGDAVAIEEVLGKEAGKPGLLIVRAGAFGLQGEVMKQLPEQAKAEEIKAALLACNKTFGAEETRKIYDAHVRAGLRKGIKVEFEIPYGEDRDGDGKRDREGGRRRRR